MKKAKFATPLSSHPERKNCNPELVAAELILIRAASFSQHIDTKLDVRLTEHLRRHSLHTVSSPAAAVVRCSESHAVR